MTGFKTSCIAVPIKILFEFTRYFKLQNVVKKSNLLQYKLEGIISGGGGLITGSTFFVYSWMGLSKEGGLISGCLRYWHAHLNLHLCQFSWTLRHITGKCIDKTI